MKWLSEVNAQMKQDGGIVADVISGTEPQLAGDILTGLGQLLVTDILTSEGGQLVADILTGEDGQTGRSVGRLPAA